MTRPTSVWRAAGMSDLAAMSALGFSVVGALAAAYSFPPALAVLATVCLLAVAAAVRSSPRGP